MRSNNVIAWKFGRVVRVHASLISNRQMKYHFGSRTLNPSYGMLQRRTRVKLKCAPSFLVYITFTLKNT